MRRFITGAVVLLMAAGICFAQGMDIPAKIAGDSRNSGMEWNEFFHSGKGLFQAKEHTAFRLITKFRR